MQLTKGMFGSEFDSKSFFGIYCGQQRSPSLVHNGGWYNKQGEKLGWGDLAPGDFKNIAKELEVGQIFIVLTERDSFWNFVKHDKSFNFGWQAQTAPDEKAPGVDYVAKHARYIISKDNFYFIDEYRSYEDGEAYEYPSEFKFNIKMTMLKRHRVKEIITADS